MSKITVIKNPLTTANRKSVETMLNAAGVVLVTRAMMKTCRPQYSNDGWQNCWFTQMFGGKANLDRMTQAFIRQTSYEHHGSHRYYDTSTYTAAIANKLGIGDEVVMDIISIFDNKSDSYSWQRHCGKVVAFLEYVDKWLNKHEVVLHPDLSAHKS